MSGRLGYTGLELLLGRSTRFKPTKTNAKIKDILSESSDFLVGTEYCRTADV